MNLFSQLFSHDELKDQGVCPNCWGQQQYDGKFREMARDKQVDVNNHEARHSFIQEFVVDHVTGIHLQKEDSGLHCPKCKNILPYDK